MAPSIGNFLFVWVGTDKLMGRPADRLVNQSLYTGVNGLFYPSFDFKIDRIDTLNECENALVSKRRHTNVGLDIRVDGVTFILFCGNCV